MFRSIAALLFGAFVINAQAIGQSAPIMLSNVEKLGLLSETKTGARFLEIGPKENELLLYPRNGVLVVDDVHFKEVRTIPAEQVDGYRFSRDLSLISWLNGKEVFIRNEATGDTIQFEGGENPGSAVFSPNNKVVVVGDTVITGSEGQGSAWLRIFDVSTGRELRKINITKSGYGALQPVFSPDGTVLAVSNRNYETKLFDTKSWDLLHILPKRMTQEVSFNSDGTVLAAAYVDGSLGLWDVATGKQIRMVDSGCGELFSVAWNPAGDLLATCGPTDSKSGPNYERISIPGKVALWNAKTLEPVKDLMTVQWSGSVRFTSDGRRLLATVTKRDTLDDGYWLAIWTTDAPQAIPAPPKIAAPKLPVTHRIQIPANPAPTVAVLPDGGSLLTPLRRKDTIAKFDLTTGEQGAPFNDEHGWQIMKVVLTADGTRAATVSLDKKVKLWDVSNGKVISTMTDHTERVRYGVFSPSGKYLLTSTNEQWPYTRPASVTARIWNGETGEALSDFTVHKDNIQIALFGPNEQVVFTGGKDSNGFLSEVSTGKQIHKLPLGGSLVSAMFHPDGSKILTSSTGHPSPFEERGQGDKSPKVVVWNPETGKQIINIPQPTPATAAFSPDGAQIVTACRGVITWWDATTGEKLETKREPLIRTEVVFSRTGRYLVVMLPGEPAELWDTEKRTRIKDLDVGETYRSFFADDERTFYSFDRAGVFRAWSLKTLKD
jgi:WD40 repeat protein